MINTPKPEQVELARIAAKKIVTEYVRHGVDLEHAINCVTAIILSTCWPEDPNWTTIGTIKVDIKNETETFTPYAQAQQAVCVKPRFCIKCYHEERHSDNEGGTCEKLIAQFIRCGCFCEFASPEVAQKNPPEGNQDSLKDAGPVSPEVGVEKDNQGSDANLSFGDAVAIARGCFDYGGGYRSDDDKMKIYHHGIQTVVNALEHAERDGLKDMQVAVLHSIGSETNTKSDASSAISDRSPHGQADLPSSSESTATRIAEIRERRANLSSPPFEVIAGDNCGHYGSGPDTHQGFVSYAVVDSQGRTIVDTFNSTATEVHEDVDEDGLQAWDEVGRNNIRFFAHAPEDIDFLLSEVDAAYIRGLEKGATVADNHSAQDCTEPDCSLTIAKDIRALIPSTKGGETIDICDLCGKEFGLSGQDANGFNSTCVHCGNNTYTTTEKPNDQR